MKNKLRFGGQCALFGALSATAAVLLATMPGQPAPLVMILLGVMVLTALLLFVVIAITVGDDQEEVDIWAPQETLMRASGQVVPSAPEITETTLLYVALTLEELAETIEVITAAMARTDCTQGHTFSKNLFPSLVALHRDLHAESSTLRRHLAHSSKAFTIPVTRDQARHLLDGVTDVAVTVAGMGLASGLPVRAAYKIIAASNLSKRNPVTGYIDKDPTGKWIKGENYTPPTADLNRLVDQCWVQAHFDDEE